MHFPAGLVALLIGAAGWYYLFYSTTARRLEPIEGEEFNSRRIILRRLNGLAILCLAVLFYIGLRAIEARSNPLAFAACWIGVLVLLVVIVILALMDLRLTANLRKRGGGDRRK